LFQKYAAGKQAEISRRPEIEERRKISLREVKERN
jgi:hypothetical protein